MIRPVSQMVRSRWRNLATSARAAPQINWAIDLDGVNDLLDAAFQGIHDEAGYAFLVTWKPDLSQDGYLALTSSLASNVIYTAGLHKATGEVRMLHRDGGLNQFDDTASVVQDGEWQKTAYTIEKSGADIVFRVAIKTSAALTTDTLTGAWGTTSARTHGTIGALRRLAGISGPLLGRIGSAHAWDTALTNAQLVKLVTSLNPRVLPGLPPTRSWSIDRPSWGGRATSFPTVPDNGAGAGTIDATMTGMDPTDVVFDRQGV